MTPLTRDVQDNTRLGQEPSRGLGEPDASLPRPQGHGGWLGSEKLHPAIANLRDNQRQIDADGTEVGVSRQALDETLTILTQYMGAMNFILAFYKPGQRHLDTEAWKQAEASARRVHALARGVSQ